MAIETQNGDYNLAAGATVFNKTAAADGEYEFEIDVGDGTKDLAAGVGTLNVTVANDGRVVGGDGQPVYKGAQTRVQLRTARIFIANGDTVTVAIASSNASDTDVDVTVVPRRVVDELVAGKLRDMLDGTGGVVLELAGLHIVAADPTKAALDVENTNGVGASLSGTTLGAEILGNAASAYGLKVEAGLDAVVLNTAWSGRGIVIDCQGKGIDIAADAGALGTALAQAIADAVLARSVAAVEGTAPEHSLCTLVLAALESFVVGTTWNIYRTDGETPHAVKTVATDPTAKPITGVG
ncbi:MAG: hypothetical protein JW809_19410 [Pirellulales bacterium]|nr:hypothetical protein [Pirellulales bacterium]